MTHLPGRRTLLKYGAAAAASASLGNVLRGQDKKDSPQRTVVIMFDGFGLDYLSASKMPVLEQWKRDGLFKPVKGLMPSVTNINNASICCGVWPETHGITGNTYFDEQRGVEEYTESPDLLLAPTLFERAARHGVKSALLSSKAKTITFLFRGAEIVLTAEKPSPEWVAKIGPVQSIYSREINYWLMAAAMDVLKNRPDIGCRVHPHHRLPDAHVGSGSAGIQGASGAHGRTDRASHETGSGRGVSADRRPWNERQDACAGTSRKCARSKGVPLRKAFSVGRDQYVKQHRGCSGGAYVYLKKPEDAGRVREIISGLQGVEKIIPREQAARDYKLMKSRIGDLVVWGDKDTTFGEMDAAREDFPTGLRSHGSLHELDIPLFVYNAKGAPSADFFQHNLDLARWMYRA